MLAVIKSEKEQLFSRCSDDIKTLMDMLSYMRPTFSLFEDRFIKKYIVPTGAISDSYGNYILRIGTAPILWSCHTDTVHISTGFEPPDIDLTSGFITASNEPVVNCLGADCTAGVWIMLEMIKAQMEGLYVFHRSEEVGGLGSTFIAEKTPHVVEGIKFAIAFDRHGEHSVITHQMGIRSCSENFGKALSQILNESGLIYYNDDTGVFTDTAYYTELIPECSNISVGYSNQHKFTAYLDVEHLLKLRDAIITSDFSNLPCERDPSEKEHQYFDGDWEHYFDVKYGNRCTPISLREVISLYPNRVANMFRSKGFSGSDLMEILEHYKE